MAFDAGTQHWPALPYEPWRETCDTVHALTQLLGKVAVVLAPPEPQLQHAALRLSARGWETQALRAPDGSGAIVMALDLHAHQLVIEHSDGRVFTTALELGRSVGEITRATLTAFAELAGPIVIDPRPQEVPWHVALDEDDLHRSYDVDSVRTYFAAATRAALVLAALRAPFRGRVTPVNAWWGSFDLAFSIYSGEPAEPPAKGFIERNSANAQQIEVGWWPGDPRHPRPAFFAFAFPTAPGIDRGVLSPQAAHWDSQLGEFLLDWDDIRNESDPHRLALDFGRSAIAQACDVCGWDPALTATALGEVPPVV